MAAVKTLSCPMPIFKEALSFTSHLSAFHLEAVPHSSNADFMLRYPYHQDPLCPPATQCQIDRSGSTYFKPDLPTSGCYQNSHDFESSNVTPGLQRTQPQQQQQYRFGSALDYRNRTSNLTVNWLPCGMMRQNTYQPTNRSLSHPQMAIKIEEGRGVSHEGMLPKAAVGAVEYDLHSGLLAIAQAVPHVCHANFDCPRGNFSSICVAGADSKFPSLVERPAITLRLREKVSWQTTWPHRMEMITSKNGRWIFPTLTVAVEGLEVNERYIFFLDLVPKDQNLYRLHSNGWIPCRTLSHPPPSIQSSHIYVSCNLCENGPELMVRGVDIKLVKITNNFSYAFIHTFARGMQIYLPRYHIVHYLAPEEVTACYSNAKGRQSDSPVVLEHVDTYIIPETEFMAKTAYRNKHNSSTKISRNSYAKAFRCCCACENRHFSGKKRKEFFVHKA
ncbi:T-box transcription factor TBX20 [Taenia solium]|eukprot:TsM_000337400 transcript=TsM_000337400 gene=TsM_000337400